MKNLNRVSRKRQAGSVRNTLIVVVLLIGVILVGISGHSDYEQRAEMAKTILLTGSLKNTISEFHVNNKRFPASREAEKFRVDGGQYAQSIIYDAEKRMADSSLKCNRVMMRV